MKENTKKENRTVANWVLILIASIFLALSMAGDALMQVHPVGGKIMILAAMTGVFVMLMIMGFKTYKEDKEKESDPKSEP